VYVSSQHSSFISYYPFGMVMPGRSFVRSGADYRFGFNGKEQDGEEWTGSAGNQLDFGNRIYDSRLGRWFGRDKLAVKYAAISPYVFAANNPVLFIDPDGLQVVVPKVGDRQPVLDAINSAFGEDFFEFDGNGRLNYTGKSTDNLDENQKKLFAYFSYVNNNDIDTYIKLNEVAMGPFYDTDEKGDLRSRFVIRGTNVGGTTVGWFPTIPIAPFRSISLEESILNLYIESKVEIIVTPSIMQNGINLNTEKGNQRASYEVVVWHELGHAFAKLFENANEEVFNNRNYSQFTEADWAKWTVGFENLYRDIKSLPRNTGTGQHRATPGGEGTNNEYELEGVPPCPPNPGCQNKGK
jgi:RHS repeat-associated protein